MPSTPTTKGRLELEPAEVPGDRAYGYIGLAQDIEATSGAHAATIAAESDAIAGKFQDYFLANGIDRWRSLGCGKEVPSADHYPQDAGLYTVQIIERRFFHVQGNNVQQKGDPIRFAHRVELKS